LNASDEEAEALQQVREARLRVAATEATLAGQREWLVEVVRAAAALEGVSQRDLARVLGVSQPAVSQMLKRNQGATGFGRAPGSEANQADAC
jgi:predicted XRE-type DNA-binding protein